MGIAVKSSVLGSDGRDSKPAYDMEAFVRLITTVNYHNVPNFGGSIMDLFVIEIQELGRKFPGLKRESVKKIREICSEKSIPHINHFRNKKAISQ